MPQEILNKHRSVAIVLAVLLQLPNAVRQTRADSNQTPYPAMAPLDQYLIEDQSAEVALARSSAPKSISDDAEVLILGRDGYNTAVKGRNGFVCLVLRSWTAGSDDPDFWNPKIRSPICLNAPAVRTYLPITLRKTQLILAGKSKEEMFQAIASALDRKELPPLEAGAMCYMMSKQQYLNDRDNCWHPHLMFFIRRTPPESWGANLAGSPIVAGDDSEDRMTIFLIPVGHWSDGTAAPLFTD